DISLNFISLSGVFGLCLIAWLFSEDRSRIPWNVIKWGIAFQFVLGLLIFVLPVTRDAIIVVNDVLNVLLDASEAGARFLFGKTIVPLAEKDANASFVELGYIFAFRSLPQVVFFSAVITLLYKMNIIPPLVRFFAKVFHRTMGISGAESLSGAANIFVGIESVVSIRKYLDNMTRSEMCAILASCFGSISSTVLGLYAGLLKESFPNITGHLLASSILTIPACFVISKILVPETSKPETLGTLPAEDTDKEWEDMSYMDALIKGAMDGVKIAVGIAAVIIAVLGCIAIVNLCFSNLAGLKGNKNLLLHFIGVTFNYISLDNFFALLFFPVTFLTGISFNLQEVWLASTLIGNRLLQTSIPSFKALQSLALDGQISTRGLLIVSYVLSGFAHIPSVGIFVGGMTNIVPSRAKDISSVAFKSLFAATLATIMTGCIAGMYDFGSPSVLGLD
ncbi:MAG: nucleoside transporter C-terminal domain-containing protein, partial [Spirochaetota bacterium]